MHPLPLHDPQELARQFNEDEAVWRCFEEKRLLRRLLGSPSLLSEKMLDDLDWIEAEREVRQVRAIGKFLPAPGEL
jgi:hypothetical protein